VPIALDVSFIERKTPPHVEEALANFIKPSSKSRTNCSLAGRKRKNCGLATEIKWTGKLVTHCRVQNFSLFSTFLLGALATELC